VTQRVLAAGMAMPLLVYTVIGAFSRYTADDFCWAGILRTDGFIDAQVYWYSVYSPRYAFTFIVNVAELIGPWLVPWLPGAAILAWLGAFTWTLRQFGVQPLAAFVLAELAAFGTLQTAPDLPQSLYWQTGMLTYLLPLILAILVIGLVRRGGPAWVALVVTFAAGGLSETYLIPQDVALTLSLLLAVFVRSSRLGVVAAALAGGVLALIAILVAPATAARVGGSPADLWLASSAAIATAAFQIIRLVRYFPYAILLCVAVPWLLGAWRCRVRRRWALIVSAVVLITLPFCYFPSFYAQNGNPPARSLIIPGAILVAYLMFLGTLVPPVSISRLRLPAAATLACIPIAIAIASAPQIPAAASYAQLFDAEESGIRASQAAGQSDVTVPPLPNHLGENFVSDDRQNWFNVCVARYYGVRSIAAAAS
jgi:hypothetical protein